MAPAYRLSVAVLKPRVQAPFIDAGIIRRDELKDASLEAAYEAANIASARDTPR